MFKKVRLATAVLKASSDFTREVCEAILVPIVMFFVVVGFFSYWITSTVYLASTGTKTAGSTPYGSLNLDEGTIWMMVFEFFGFIWNASFALAFTQFVLASACCMWYFSDMGKNMDAPVRTGVTRGLIHHGGSLALGSLILAFLWLIKFMLELVHVRKWGLLIVLKESDEGVGAEQPRGGRGVHEVLVRLLPLLHFVL